MRDAGELDNRGSHFYIALYWAQALATQTQDLLLQKQFNTVMATLLKNEQKIVHELNSVQGVRVDVGGYYKPDPILCNKLMKPSATFNNILGDI
jgi:isocitrate dehydrogenase